MSSRCPDDDELLAFSARTLSRERREAIAAHLDQCDECRAVLAGVATSEEDGPREEGGERYELLSTLGAGAMGVVQAAFDRELGRKVALKFLRAEPCADGARGRERLLREAQALARLAHPNVITVHDVGLIDGDVFVAMEIVEGLTLRTWLAAAPRTQAAIVGVLRQAGEGLAAAHAAGLVHRDFKPDNVLVGHDGRVRVTDFGLARAAAEAAEPAAIDEAPSLRADLTNTGVIAGTPAYMAPEQRARRAADPRSDQYSFCVTLHEAITGARPGGAPARRAPAWLRRIVLRGLREEPRERWPSMRPLLDALARGPRVTARRATIAMGALALASAPVFAIAWRAPAAPSCAPDPAAYDAAWSEARREQVRAAFRAADAEQAEFAFGLVDDALARQRDRWVAMRVESCVATRLRHEQSETLFDLRGECLDRQRGQVAAVVDVFAAADRRVVEESGATVAALPSEGECARVRALEAVDPLPSEPARREGAAAAERALAQATALFETGKNDEGLAIVRQARDAAKLAAYAPLDARILLLQAQLEAETGKGADSERTLHESARKAIESHDDTTAAQAWTMLAWQTQFRQAEARTWAGYADAGIRRLGGDDYLEADRLATLGVVELDAGNNDEARALLLRARPLVVKSRGAEYTRIAGIDDSLGNIALAEQDVDGALRLHQQARAMRERLLGPRHGATITSMYNEIADRLALGDADRALAVIDEIASRKPEERSSPYWRLTRAGALRAKSQPAAALEDDRAAVAAYEATLAPGDSLLAMPLTGEGEDLLALGRAADAIAPLERAATLRASNASPPEQSETLFALARALAGAHRDRARARGLAERAAELLRPDAARYGGRYARDLSDIEAWIRDVATKKG